jgi:hypothetical protein
MMTRAVDSVCLSAFSLCRHFKAPRTAVVSALCGVFLLGCGKEGAVDVDSASDTILQPFVIHIKGPGETPVSSFVAVISRDESHEELECPGGSGTDITCSADQISFQEMPSSITVTIKSPGFRFVSKAWSAEEISSMTEATISLSPLAPFETNADFTTGFTKESNEADFMLFSQKTAGNLGAQYIVKFYMEETDSSSPTVYFMNTTTHFLHYQFVHDVLHKPLSEIEYQEQTYVNADRTAMAGTLMYFPDAKIAIHSGEGNAVAPMIMTFFSSDRLTPEHAATAHRLIEERLGFLSLFGESHRLFYLPPGETQQSALLEQSSTFAEAGMPWMKKSELYADTTMQILNEGEAFGTLYLLSAEELEASTFSYRDILILTTMPLDLPLAGGTITEEFQTPLSHVNVAAMNRGTPNISLPGAGEMEEITSLIGSPVHFVVKDGTFTLEASTAEEVEAFWDARQPPIIDVEADTEFSEIRNLDEIAFADSVRFGAKAANVAELSLLLGENAPHGFAVPFFYYDQFAATAEVTALQCADAKADCIEEGRTPELCESAEAICEENASSSLQQYIEAILELDSFSTDAALREVLLDGIRYHFRNTPIDAEFADVLNAKVLETFNGEKVRLRSSTNAEDLADFTGAGLYDSVSAYGDVAGDLPSDEIRKVWASLWNFRAFEERSFWNINHLSVHMGVLVHEAFPDEAANGVLITRNLAEPTVDGFYVNVQAGENSVTNPLLGSPEIFSIIQGAADGYIQSAVYAYSSLMPEQRILTDEEVLALYQAAVSAQEHFASLYDISYWETSVFDIEFKFLEPSRQLIIKQIRPFHAAR